MASQPAIKEEWEAFLTLTGLTAVQVTRLNNDFIIAKGHADENTLQLKGNLVIELVSSTKPDLRPIEIRRLKVSAQPVVSEICNTDSDAMAVDSPPDRPVTPANIDNKASNDFNETQMYWEFGGSLR
ncbi:MAG: hypothetical protein M1831_000618 [Alyxoria varia]|nr:MAG: hypothetical protein M1831_000618 [Alyxoria varia]